MKTFHRLMYENLTKDEYKELCRLGNVFDRTDCGIKPDWDYTCKKPEWMLSGSFLWEETPQKSRYWEGVFARLERQSQSDTINTAL